MLSGRGALCSSNVGRPWGVVFLWSCQAVGHYAPMLLSGYGALHVPTMWSGRVVLRSLTAGTKAGTQKLLTIFVIVKTKYDGESSAIYKHITYDILSRRGCLSTSAWCPAPHRVVSLSQCVTHTTDTRPHFTNSADFSHEHAGNFLCASLHAYTILNGNDCISRAPVRVSRPSLLLAYTIYHTELSWITGPNLD